MKKGLLSLLAVALTVVGCQNYDDQFQSLTDQITELATAVDGLTAVRDQVTALTALVEGLTTAVQTVDDEVGALSTGLGTISSTLADVASQLNDVALTTAQLDTMSKTLLDIEVDVHELLEASAVINQDVVINNAATLEYVSNLIMADGPDVIVNGSVTINTRSFVPTITTEQLELVNAISAKLATILGNNAGDGLSVTSDTPIALDALTFIDASYTIVGSDMGDNNLRTVSGNISIDHGGANGPVDYSQIVSAGDLDIAETTATSATSINFSGIAGGALTQDSSADLDFDNATGEINMGKFSFTDLTAPKATSILSIAEELPSFTISAAAATSISLEELATATGAISITGSTTTIVELTKLTSATTIDVVGPVAQFHIPEITVTTGAYDIDATTVNFSKLATVSHTVDLNTVETILGADVITSITAALTIDNGPIILENAQVTGGGQLTSANATQTTVGGSDDANLANLISAATTHLVVSEQNTDTTLDVAAALIQNLSITASGTAAETTFTHDAAAAVLAEVTIDGFYTATIPANSSIVTLTTAGTMHEVSIVDATGLVSLDLGHVYDLAYTEAQRVTLTGNTALTGVDLTSVERLGSATITGNTAMTTITAPGTSNPLTPGALINIDISGNSLTATWTYATPLIADGINDTPYGESKVYQPSLLTWKAYLMAQTTVNTITGNNQGTDANGTPVTNVNSFSFDYDASNITGGGSFALDSAYDQNAANQTEAGWAMNTWTGTIDTEEELVALQPAE